MAKVYINNRNDFEKQLSAFVRMCKKEKIVRETIKKSHFTSPGEISRYEKLKRRKANFKKRSA